MFDECLYFNTSALSRLLERKWAQAFKPFGLTPPQAFMLRLVLNQPGMLQRELAEKLTISRPTATRLLDGLQEKGLIQRHSSKNDGRESAIHPAKASLPIQADLNAASASVTRKLKTLLGETHFVSTVGQLRHIRTALK